jgi:mRNA interferase MazF
MVNKVYVPDQGDIIWLQFDPQTGVEQAGRRPAVVLSQAAVNMRSGLVIVCPITSRVKGYPFEVQLPVDLAISGVVLVDQIKSLDWRVRNATFADKVPTLVLDMIRVKLITLIS